MSCIENINIIKNIISNFKRCNIQNKNVKAIFKSEYIINKIFEHPEYIFIIIYKLNINNNFDLILLYIVYLIAIMNKKEINISLLNISILIFVGKFNLYIKKIDNYNKLIIYESSDDNYEYYYHEIYNPIFYSKNNLIQNNIINDFGRIMI